MTGIRRRRRRREYGGLIVPASLLELLRIRINYVASNNYLTLTGKQNVAWVTGKITGCPPVGIEWYLPFVKS